MKSIKLGFKKVAKDVAFLNSIGHSITETDTGFMKGEGGGGGRVTVKY